MTPDPAAVRDLDASLSAKNMGVVAHYYMDAELQVGTTMLRANGSKHNLMTNTIRIIAFALPWR